MSETSFDHAFAQEEPYCANCGTAQRDCECGDFELDDNEDTCAKCGMPESDPQHEWSLGINLALPPKN